MNGRYAPSDYNASFVGFLPSREPRVAIIVVIDSPHAGPYTGGPVSGPVFQRIAQAALRHLGIVPTLNAPPPVLVARQTNRSRFARRHEGHGGHCPGRRLPECAGRARSPGAQRA